MRVLMGVLLMLRIKVVLFCEEVIVSELDDMFCVFMRTVVVIRAREQLTDSVHRYDWPNPRRPLTDFLLNPPTSDSQTIHHVTKTPAISRDLRLDTSSLGHISLSTTMEASLKALKVVELKEILQTANVSLAGKQNKADLINKILASQQAIDTYNAKYKPSPVPPPPEPAQASQPAPAESVCSPSLSISNALMPF